LLTVLGLFFRFKDLAGRGLTGDEIFQWNNTVGPLKPFWQRLPYGDMTAFPGEYLLTYPFVRFFGQNKWGLAIPHIIATVIGFYVLYLICRRYYKSSIGFLVAFTLVAFHEGLIFHSFEFRPYAVLPTLMLMSFYLTERVVFDFKRLTTVQKWLAAVFYILTLWYHSFGILIVGISFLYFGLLTRGRILTESGRSFWMVLLSIALIALPVWIWYSLGPPNAETPAMRVAGGKHPFEFCPNPFHGFGRFFNRMVLYNLTGFKRLYFLLSGLALAWLVPFTQRMRRLGFFLTVILLPVEVILFASLANSYWFLLRQYIFLAPMFAFFLGWLWDGIYDYYVNLFRETRWRGWSWRERIGLILSGVCWFGGLAGWVSHVWKSL